MQATLFTTIPNGEAGFDEIEREELSRLFGRVAWARVAALPVLVGLVIGLLVTDETLWRRLLLGTLMVLATAFFLSKRHATAWPVFPVAQLAST